MKPYLRLLYFLLTLLRSFSYASATRHACNCAGTLPSTSAAAVSYVCRDPRLGPIRLPERLPLSGLLTSYDRFGGTTPGKFLAKWTDASGSYVYPPQNGFQLDTNGKALNGTMVLQVGTLIDRFGSEYGSFVSAAEAPYSQRALPPSNLDANPSAPDFPYNYHLYRVVKPLTVVGGPIAPWFGQPGLGAQFFTGNTGNIMALVSRRFLERVDPRALNTGRRENGCGGSSGEEE